MPNSQNRSRSRDAARGRRTLLFVALASVALVAFAVVRLSPGIEDAETAATDLSHVGPDASVTFPIADGGLLSELSDAGRNRPVYRYSVVPGGTYTSAELQTAIATDPVVATHYAQVDLSRVRVERVTRDRLVHVSYRNGDEVFWTKRKVLLRQGETILTDGTTQIRARCGNCISDEPLLPTSESEPDAVEFDRLVDESDTPPRVTPPDPVIVPPFMDVPSIVQDVAPDLSGTPAPFASHRFGAPEPLAALTPGGRPIPTGDPIIDMPNPLSPRPGIDPPPTGGVPPGGPGPLVPADVLFPGVPPTISNTPPLMDDDPPPGNPVPVPEPGTILLIGVGAAAALRVLRARSRR